MNELALLQHHGNRLPESRGFTLIEILIVLVIVSILVSIGIPRYSNYLTMGRRIDGELLLRQNALILDRCITFVGSYESDCALLLNSQEGYYQLQETRTATTFFLTAVPTTKDNHNKDTECLSLTLTHTREKSATGSKPELCWK